eukprot:EG_transcript_14161
MTDFESMGFDEARDSLSRDHGHSMAHFMAQTFARTASAPQLRGGGGGGGGSGDALGLPAALGGLFGGALPTLLLSMGGGGPFVSRDELQTLLLNQSEPQWTPASAQDIRDLPVVSIQPGHLKNTDTKTCTVCQEDFRLGERATLLTCGHLFHADCITPWLEKNRTCPLCRKEVVNVREERLAAQATAHRSPPAVTQSRHPVQYRVVEGTPATVHSYTPSHTRLPGAAYAPQSRGYAPALRYAGPGGRAYAPLATVAPEAPLYRTHSLPAHSVAYPRPAVY